MERYLGRSYLSLRRKDLYFLSTLLIWVNVSLFSRYIQPICLPSGPLITRDFTGALPVVLGWGTTHYGGEEVSTLRGVALPVWTRSDCDQAYFQPITEVFLCAGFADGGKDACQGDSGGPLGKNYALEK